MSCFHSPGQAPPPITTQSPGELSWIPPVTCHIQSVTASYWCYLSISPASPSHSLSFAFIHSLANFNPSFFKDKMKYMYNSICVINARWLHHTTALGNLNSLLWTNRFSFISTLGLVFCHSNKNWLGQKDFCFRTGEMAQRVRVLTALPKVLPSSDPRNHMVTNNHP